MVRLSFIRNPSRPRPLPGWFLTCAQTVATPCPSRLQDVLPQPRDMHVGDVVRPVHAPHVQVEPRPLLGRHLHEEPLDVGAVKPTSVEGVRLVDSAEMGDLLRFPPGVAPPQHRARHLVAGGVLAEQPELQHRDGLARRVDDGRPLKVLEDEADQVADHQRVRRRGPQRVRCS
jgi:hypothetical protein